MPLRKPHPLWLPLVVGWLMGLVLVSVLSAMGSAQAATLVASRPERIVSLAPPISENIFLLGAGDSLVGDTVYCTRPPAAQTKEKVGSVQELSVEKIVRLRPQLVLASNLTPPLAVTQLRQLGLRVETFGQPASFADVCNHLLRLGSLLGREETAGQIVTAAQRQVEAVQQALAAQPSRRVFLQVGAQPLFASVPSSFTNDYIRLAGGTNVMGEQRTGLVSVEQVLALNPEVIIIAVMGTEHGVGAEEKRRWLSYPALAAVQRDSVFVLNPDPVCSPSPPTFAATLKELARLIHPEAAEFLNAVSR